MIGQGGYNTYCTILHILYAEYYPSTGYYSEKLYYTAGYHDISRGVESSTI